MGGSIFSCPWLGGENELPKYISALFHRTDKNI